MMVSTPWPPPYLIKKHPRARSVKLRIRKPDGLVITVPPRFSLREIPLILEEHKGWISKQLAQLQAALLDVLPTQVDLRAIQKTILVHYMESLSKTRIISRPHQEIVVVGKVNDRDLCRKLLVSWTKEQAKTHLETLLDLISVQTQLSFREVRIRDQSTVWGSCTVLKSISLNYKLLFLPPPLTRYVLIHELCHTVHLNHSASFWRLVEKFDPHWREHRAELRKGEKYIPGWL